MKNFNEKNFMEDLLNQHWEYIYFFGKNPNTMWELWKELFPEVLNKHAPLQHKKTKSSKVAWITNSIKGLINASDKSYTLIGQTTKKSEIKSTLN